MLSPSTRRTDLGSTMSLYADVGVEPRLRAFEVRDGAQVLVGDVAGEAAWTSSVPYAVTIVPASLID